MKKERRKEVERKTQAMCQYGEMERWKDGKTEGYRRCVNMERWNERFRRCFDKKRWKDGKKDLDDASTWKDGDGWLVGWLAECMDGWPD